MLRIFMQWLHVASVIAAIGGVTFIVLVLAPASGAIAPQDAGKLMAAVGGRFAVLVWLAIAGISVSGIYMAFTQTPLRAWRDLVATPYGKLLLAKIVLGVVIAKISLALTLPLHFLAGVQEQMLGLLWVNFILAIVVITIATRLRRSATLTA
jgi:uncharacterized membrane protein